MHTVYTWLVSIAVAAITACVFIVLVYGVVELLGLIVSLPGKFLLLFMTQSKLKQVKNKVAAFIGASCLWFIGIALVLGSIGVFAVLVELVKRLLFK
jgi:hypothetical protein